MKVPKNFTRLFYFIICCFSILVGSYTRVFSQVNAGFSANITSGCSPLVVIYSDQSTGSPTTWNWNLGNGNNSNLQNPGATYVNPGTYTVTLTVSNGGSNDTETKTAYITVFANPVADFSGTPLTGCLPLTVNFSDQSTPGTGAINQWFWDFGDGVNSNQQNPSHTYTSPGNFTVSLVVTDVNGCTKSITKSTYINAFTGAVANFSAASTSSCTLPFNVNFTNSSTGTGGLTYQWLFQGGTPATSNTANPSVTYNAAGSFNVTLVVTDGGGCKDTLVQNNFIRVIQSNFTAIPVSGCTPLAVNFTNTSLGNPTTYLWDFGDASPTSSLANPSHTYTTPGTYTVTLTTGNGACTDNEVKISYITVGDMAAISFTASDTVPCQVPSNITFTDNTPGAVAWQWNFGDGTNSTTGPVVAHTYNSTGNFSVSLEVTVSNGCTDSLVKTNYIILQKPLANFTPDTNKGCVPLPVQFTDASTSGSPIVNWNWDFGDGSSTSTLQNPTFTYTDTGQYLVVLQVTNSKGCTDTAATIINAGMKPTANFSGTPLSGCRPLTVDFTDQSSNFANTWFWSFGDGQTDDTQNPSHIYNDTGTFDVTLVVSNNGCTDTLIFPDYVTVFPPRAVFSVLPGTIGCSTPFTVSFQEQSQGADTWFWDFGNGNTFTGQNPPPYTYNTGGQFSIKLVVTNNASGCADSTFQTIRISDPAAAFSVSGSGCQPLLATFSDSSTSPFGVRNWQWIFGDGYSVDNLAGQLGTANVPNGTNDFLTTGTYKNPVHTYMNPGTYTVTLIITDQLVCQDTLTYTNVITVNQIPTVNITSDKQTGCPPFTVQFTDLSTGAVGMEEWSWNFGDGTADTVQNPVHTYTDGGIYTVTLIGTDSNGCISGIVKNNYITVVSPSAGFFSNTGTCIGISQLFTDTSDASNPIAQWFWDFGDGVVDSVQNPTHIYGSSGVFDVALAITDTAGCVDTVVKTNYMTVQEVTANFGANPTVKNCPPLNVKFTDSSSIGVVSWLWLFGDGNVSTLPDSAWHLYNAPGKYDVTLIVTTSLGCKDTLVKPELIKIDGPNGDLVFLPDSGCPGTTIGFDTANVQNAISYTWDFGDGNIISSPPPVTHQYFQVGVYHPFLTFQDAAGCSFGVQSPDSIQIVNIPVDAGPDITICEGDSAMLQASGGIIYTWSPAGGLGTTSISNPMAGPADTTEYFVLIEDGDGCQNTDSVIVRVNHNIPIADFSATSVCLNEISAFTDLTAIAVDTIDTWAWVFNNGEGFSGDTNPTFTFSSAGTFTIKLTVTAKNGCEDTLTKQVTVFSLPQADAGNDAGICIGGSTTLLASGGISYLWMPSVSLNNTTVSNPVASPSLTETYFVIVEDINNCLDTDSVEVVVNPLPNANAGNDLQICLGDSTQLSASGGITYAWVANSTLSDTTIASPFAEPVDTTSYYVYVTDVNGCVNSDTVVITVNPNKPIADFSATMVCKNESTDFSDQSAMVGDTLISWNWDLNGFANTTDTNPSFVFPDSGNFVVTLTVETNVGCNDTIIKTVRVHPLPDVNAGNDDTICIYQSVQLLATGGVDYAWNTDGTLSDTSLANPIASPLSGNSYYVFATDSNSCVNSDTVTIIVNPLPFASAGPDKQICLGESTQLNASGGEIYAWNPDATLSETDTSSPTATPADTTLYIVTVTDTNGCINSDSVVITVNPNFPVAAFSADNVCEENSTTFLDQSSVVGDTITGWQWNFGDTNTDIAQSPSHPYSSYGDYQVTLVITTNNNCTDTLTDTVFVYPKPQADFNVTDNCIGIITTFKDTSQMAQGSVTGYLWDFGDNSGGLTVPNPQHNYASIGIYPVTLIVISDFNCRDTIVKSIQVYPKPDAEFSAAIACLNQATLFTDESVVDTSATIVSWNWTFGDGTGLSADSNPSYTYNNAGTYSVKLVVATGGGKSCSDSATHEVVVNPLPEPNCQASPAETNTRSPEIQFSTNPAVTYLWDFAGLDTSSLSSPSFSFPDSGTYTVTLTATNQFGCSDTCQVDIRVNPYYALEVPNAFTPNASGPNGGDYSLNPANNDVFFPITKYVTEYQMLIYNRWGELLFVSSELKVGWDGYYKGMLCQQDVYVWKIKATFADGNKITKAGDVTLLR